MTRKATEEGWGRHQLALRENGRLDAVVRRSTLIVPVNVPRFLAKAKSTEADCVMVDLEDSIPPAEKERARAVLPEAVASLRGGAFEVHVRVNNDFTICTRDIQAAVSAGATGIFIQKLDDADKVTFIDRFLSYQESLCNVAPGTIQISLSIDVPLAFFRLEEILSKSDRITAAVFSSEDMAMQLDVRPTDAGMERFLGNATIVLAGAAFGAQPHGLLGSVANYKDLAAFEEVAARSAAFGFKGAPAIHPDQVPILNRCFMPSSDEVAWARRVIGALEADATRGAASVDGKMVDAPTAQRAKNLIARSETIEKRDRLRRSLA